MQHMIKNKDVNEVIETEDSEGITEVIFKKKQ